MAAWLAPFMTALKGFTCFWSLVTMAVAAATQSKLIAASESLSNLHLVRADSQLRPTLSTTPISPRATPSLRVRYSPCCTLSPRTSSLLTSVKKFELR